MAVSQWGTFQKAESYVCLEKTENLWNGPTVLRFAGCLGSFVGVWQFLLVYWTGVHILCTGIFLGTTVRQCEWLIIPHLKWGFHYKRNIFCFARY